MKLAGDAISLRVAVGQLPDAAPVAKIYRDASLVETVSLPIKGRDAGYFHRRYVLDGSAGNYVIVYQWQISSVLHSRAESFIVLAGGGAEGTIISLTALDRPEARYVLYETEGGKFKSGRNPS